MSGQLTNMWLIKTRLERVDTFGMRLELRPYCECNDGYRVSIQASKNHYCTPKSDTATWYDTVEVWGDECYDELLEPYGTGEDPYDQVPVEVMDKLLLKHGDIKDEKRSKMAGGISGSESSR